MNPFWLAGLWLTWLSTTLSAQEPDSPGRSNSVAFAGEVQPIFRKSCIKCHGRERREGGLRLDVSRLALRGGDSGPVLVAGNAEDSVLYRRIAAADPAERMPPEGDPLTGREVAIIRAWINAGADWPAAADDPRADVDPRRDHWAYQPIGIFPVPAAEWGSWSRNPIDQFVLARLQDNGLQPSGEADRRTLIRRLSLDLLGLPPDPERVRQFESDPDPLAWEKLVDEYLESPRYGERWARHWLDIAHYADTHGFERDKLREHAWRYRDHVIQALNRDDPYDEFLIRQIAGDVIQPEDPNAIIATGFLASGPWDFVGQVETRSPVLRRQARADDLDDMITQVMTSTMGVTINCARCHDHKLDPISQDEYYGLWAVFSGVRRGDRDVDPDATRRHEAEIQITRDRLRDVHRRIGELTGAGLSLADIVGGGSGRGDGETGAGIELRSAGLTEQQLGYHRDLPANRLQFPEWSQDSKVAPGFVLSVFLPDGREPVPIAPQLAVKSLPPTSGHSWDAIRNGPLNAQVSTRLDGVDYVGPGHRILGLHANSGITFDLQAIRSRHRLSELRLMARVGSGSNPDVKATRVDFSVFVDTRLAWQKLKMSKSDVYDLDVPIPAESRTLTLVATDGGDGIGHDLLFLGDPELKPDGLANPMNADQRRQLAELRSEAVELEAGLRIEHQPRLVYAIQNAAAEPVNVLRRGNPEDPLRPAQPRVLDCLTMLEQPSGLASDHEGQRRLALARWITDSANPLTARVAVNRLWHHHFGTGIVATPSDFGLGGARPTHPELLDWLARELVRKNWSLKAIHRLILQSATWRQRSTGRDTNDPAWQRDAGNQLLWRQNGRRLAAESIRDAVLSVTGCRNDRMYGPGYRDFKYTEAYAPIYEYVTPDSPELWRRSIYRFIVRTTPDQFMTTLDCPNPANLTPRRLQTTTALQALALMNNDFMLQQSKRLAERCRNESRGMTEDAVERLFELTLQRVPEPQERAQAVQLASRYGLPALCRAVLNANEFLYVD